MSDRYEARMNLHGTTQRERLKNRTKANLRNKVTGSLSYKDILLNGKETQLVIDSDTQTYYKEFKSLPDQIINIGDYVVWANSHWIVDTCDSDDEIYRNGSLKQCNYLLKWQNERGEIIERWAFIQSASKYNDGTDGNNVITLGSDQLSVMIPLDEEALKLKKSMGKKFFIDNNKEDPTTYELTGTGNVVDTYNGYGITSWIVKEVAYTASEDDLKYGVCDYKTPNSSTPTADNVNEMTVSKAVITFKGNQEFKIGGSVKTLNGSFVDKTGNTTEGIGVWEVVTIDELLPHLEYTIDKNMLKIKVLDTELIDSKVRIIFSSADNTISTHLDFDVVSMF